MEQAYDVTVDLTVPRSPTNLERGNFMVALYALRSLPDNPALAFKLPSDPYEHVTDANVVFASRRPALIPYEDPLVAMASRVLFLLYHIMFAATEQVTLTMPMGELVNFRDVLPLSILLDVQAGQALQVYSATVTLVARLSGLRWFMYNHRIVSFVVCTAVFWLFEMVSTILAWLILAYVLSGTQTQRQLEFQGKGRPWSKELGERRLQQDKAGRSGSSRHEAVDGPIKSELDASSDEVDVKLEGTEEDLLGSSVRHGGDADDEEGDIEDLGLGTTGSALHEGKGAGSLRRRMSQKGRLST